MTYLHFPTHIEIRPLPETCYSPYPRIPQPAYLDIPTCPESETHKPPGTLGSRSMTESGGYNRHLFHSGDRKRLPTHHSCFADRSHTIRLCQTPPPSACRQSKRGEQQFTTVDPHPLAKISRQKLHWKKAIACRDGHQTRDIIFTILKYIRGNERSALILMPESLEI